MKPVQPRTEHTADRERDHGIASLKARPLTGVWQVPYEEDDPDYLEIVSLWPLTSPIDPPPALVNSFRQPTSISNLQRFAYRWHTDGALEFRGHLDTSGGASSGTIAITLPPSAITGLSGDQYFHTTITEDDGSSFTLALVSVDSTTGAVTLTWPAS